MLHTTAIHVLTDVTTTKNTPHITRAPPALYSCSFTHQKLSTTFSTLQYCIQCHTVPSSSTAVYTMRVHVQCTCACSAVRSCTAGIYMGRHKAEAMGYENECFPSRVCISLDECVPHRVQDPGSCSPLWPSRGVVRRVPYCPLYTLFHPTCRANAQHSSRAASELLRTRANSSEWKWVHLRRH